MIGSTSTASLALGSQPVGMNRAVIRPEALDVGLDAGPLGRWGVGHGHVTPSFGCAPTRSGRAGVGAGSSRRGQGSGEVGYVVEMDDLAVDVGGGGHAAAGE